MQYRKIISFVLTASMAAALVTGCGSESESAQDTVAQDSTENTTEEAAEQSTGEEAADGESYTAAEKGFGGDVTVTISVEDGKVTSASVEGPDETEGKGSLAVDAFNEEDYTGTDLADLSFDGITGATVTSTAIQNDIKDIKIQAGVISDDSETKTAMQAGTYTETVYGNNYSMPFEVTVTLSENSIDDIEVTDEGGETHEIIQTAIDSMIPDIEEYQSLAVDSVTGATASSSGIKTAVANAIDEAGGDSSQWYTEVEKNSDTVDLDGYDIVVVGLGGSGVAAFLSAADSGARVIGIDSAAKVGGTSSQIGGPMAVNPETEAVQPDENAQGEYPIDEAGFVSQWEKDTNGDAKSECIELEVDQSGDTLDWLVEDHDFSFSKVTTFMQYPYLLYADYDQSENTITEQYEKALDEACQKNASRYMTNVKGEKILTDENGRVCGVEAVASNGTTYEIHADAVILATGGYGGSSELTEKYTGTTMNLYGMYQNDGTMIEYAIENLNAGTYNIGTPGVAHTVRTTTDLKSTDITPSHQKTLDAIIASTDALHVDQNGDRFCAGDEANDITENCYKSGDCYYTIVSDAYLNNLKENGFSDVYMMLNIQDFSITFEQLMNPDAEVDPDKAKYALMAGDPITDMDEIISLGEDLGIVVEADSVEELGEKIGASDLNQTVTAYNKYAEAGEDPEFGKSAENMTAVTGSKYYAIKGCGYCYSTCGGLDVNENIEVLDQDGNVIDGLYACGTDSMGVLLSEESGYIDYGGVDHGWCLTSGRTAGVNAAAYVKENS